METNKTLDFNEHERIENPHESSTVKIIQKIFLPLIILFGLLCNVLFLVQLFRRRLWKRNSGYVSLAVLLVTDLIYTASVLIPYMLSVMDESLRIPVTSDIGCECWFLYFEVLNSGLRWVVFALLLCAFIRLRIRTPNLFGTPRGVMIVNGVIFLVLFIAGIMFITMYDHRMGHMDYTNSCYYELVWDSHYFAFSLLTNKLPILLFIPIFLIITTCKVVRKKNRPTTNPIATLDQEEDADTTEFSWTSIGVGLAIFICFLPLNMVEVVYYFLKYYRYYDWKKMFDAYLMTDLVSDFHLVIVPLICFALNKETRQFIKSKLFLTGRPVGIPSFSPATNDAISLVETGSFG